MPMGGLPRSGAVGGGYWWTLVDYGRTCGGTRLSLPTRGRLPTSHIRFLITTLNGGSIDGRGSADGPPRTEGSGTGGPRPHRLGRRCVVGPLTVHRQHLSRHPLARGRELRMRRLPASPSG